MEKAGKEPKRSAPKRRASTPKGPSDVKLNSEKSPPANPADSYEALEESKRKIQEDAWKEFHGADIIAAMGSQATGEKALSQTVNPTDSDEALKLTIANDTVEKPKGEDFGNAILNAENPTLEKPLPPITPENLNNHTQERQKQIATELIEKGGGEKGLTLVRSVGEWYKNQKTWKKVAFAGSMMGLSVAGGVFTGGALGVALLSAGLAGSTVSRVVASVAAFVTGEEVSRWAWKKATGKKQEIGMNRHLVSGITAAVLVGFMPTIMSQTGAGEFLGHKLSLAGSWLSSQFDPSGVVADASEMGAAAGTAFPSDSISNFNVSPPGVYPGAVLNTGPVSFPFSEYGNGFDVEPAVPAVPEALTFAHEVTVPKDSNAWKEILKSLPDDLTPQGHQNMTGNVQEYLRAHPELNPDIKDIAKIQPGTVIHLPPAEEMAKWHTRALSFGSVQPLMPTPPVPPISSFGVPPLGVHADAFSNTWPDGFTHNEPSGVLAPTPNSIVIPSDTGEGVATSPPSVKPYVPPVDSLDKEIPEFLNVVAQTPNTPAFNSFVQDYFPQKSAFISFFGFGGDVKGGWDAIAPLQISDITGPEGAIKVSTLVSPSTLASVQADIARVLQAVPDISATNSTVEQIIKAGFEKGILTRTVST